MRKLAFALAASLTLLPAAALAQDPVRTGGNVKAPERIKYVAPVYPQIAQSAQVSGVVIMELVVGTDGSPVEAKILKSIPLLDQAAIDAVRQWRYTPTTLNGVPVPVIMTVTVNFALDGSRQSDQAAMGAVASNQSLAAASADNVMSYPPNVVRIGGDVKAPERVKYVAPVYPEVAQTSRVAGVIVVEALIDEAGNVSMAKVLKSIPLLDQAAIDAVLQWKYTPTLLNGAAVPVVMTVTINFTLQ
jgi:TonB family protein